MKALLTISLLTSIALPNLCWGQFIEKIYFPDNHTVIKAGDIDPDTGELQRNNSTDRRSDQYKDAYFKYTYGDTINEFFHKNDSTYLFQQTIKETKTITGNFKVIEESYQYEKCVLGQY